MEKPNNRKTTPMKAIGYVSAISADLLVCMAAGYVGGRYISSWLNQQIWTALGTIAGLLLGIVSVIILIIRFLRDNP
ncbi:AtpZ/AtpI family protein [Marinicrinis sediminis]|uniref:AtpZ/AtpI family protein n=1 Tax=Marinicrinis sediminis TaxID=1652465 RepID=A0ABW5RCF0_9BACL